MPGKCSNCFFKAVAIGNKGPEDSPFVIVGESPGLQEVVKGIPFIGPSGEVLDKTIDKALRVLNIPREVLPEPYITNAISCWPRKVPDKKEQQERMQKACIACRGRLFDDIQKHPRKLIMALGNPAIWSLTGDFSLKITQERGRIFESSLSELGILATVHPAFLLRGNGNYTQFEGDFKYGLSLVTSDNPQFKLPNGATYRILESLEETRDFASELQAMHEDDYVAHDIETEGFNFQDDRIIVTGIQHKPGLVTLVPGEFIIPELYTGEVRQVWHNGKFDIKFLRYQKKCLSARVDGDTMLLSYTLNERRGIHDLDQVASDRLGSPKHKAMVDQYLQGTVIDEATGLKRHKNYGDIPLNVLYKYTALDLADTYELFPTMLEEVEADKKLTRFYYHHCIPASEYLTEVEMNGFDVDWAQVQSNSERLQAEEDKLETALNLISQEAQGCDINPRSWQQVQLLLYTALNLSPKKDLGTDDNTLKSLPLIRGDFHPAVRIILAYRKVRKSRGTYCKNLLGREKKGWVRDSEVFKDDRVHPTFMIHGTPTSRLACNGPNMQNVQRDPKMRGQFIPPPGYGVIEVDYSQAELRSLAALSGCPDLGGIFLSGGDLHVEFSTYLFGSGFTKEEKMAAKTVNFGIPYGRTAISIALDADLSAKMPVTVDLAQSWIDGWGKRFPRAWEFIQECRMAPLRNQTMSTVFGNKKRPGVVSEEKLNDIQNQSANFPHQSTASNLTIRAGIELIDTLRDDYDTRIRNTVHDCIVASVPLHVPTIKAVAKVMMDKMEEIPKRYPYLKNIPFKAEPEFGLRWGNLLKFYEIETQYGWDLSKIPDQIAAH